MDKLQLVVTSSQALRLAEFLLETKTGFSFSPDGSQRWLAEPQCTTMMEALKLGMALKELRIEPENLGLESIKEFARERRSQARTGRRTNDNGHEKEIGGVTLDLSAPLDLKHEPENQEFQAHRETREAEEGLLFGLNGQDHDLN
jgi:hypothetical protein